MDNNKLIVIRPVCDSRERATRLDLVLAPWLDEIEKNGIHVILLERAEDLLNTDLRDSRILFAISLTEAGVNIEYYRLLEHLRAHHDCLSGSAGGIIVDGAGEFYTKAIARRFAFSADMAGCTFPGKALVEATGSLGNFHVLSQISGKEPIEVYKAQVGKWFIKCLAIMNMNPAESHVSLLCMQVHGRPPTHCSYGIRSDLILTDMPILQRYPSEMESSLTAEAAATRPAFILVNMARASMEES